MLKTVRLNGIENLTWVYLSCLMAPCGFGSPFQSCFKPGNAVTSFLIANCSQSSLRHQEESLSITWGTWLSHHLLAPPGCCFWWRLPGSCTGIISPGSSLSPPLPAPVQCALRKGVVFPSRGGQEAQRSNLPCCHVAPAFSKQRNSISTQPTVPQIPVGYEL